MESKNSHIILEAKQISKSFRGAIPTPVLRDITFSIAKSEFVAITGKSGCGKSTLLYVLSTMDTDYEGSLFIDNETMLNRKEDFLARIRNEKIGFVFQFHYLLTEFNVLDNVMLPALKLNKRSKEEIERNALEKLNMLGIKKLAYKKANLLSGGEKQRVAIARALINDPLIIMCDEPTGNLDKHNSDIVYNIFRDLCRNQGQTLLVVTHDPDFASKTERIIEMEDGRILRQ